MWRLGVRPAPQVAAVDSGKTDVAFDGVPPDRLAEVTTQYASQVRENPTPRTTFAFLRSRLSPRDARRFARRLERLADDFRAADDSEGEPYGLAAAQYRRATDA